LSRGSGEKTTVKGKNDDKQQNYQIDFVQKE